MAGLRPGAREQSGGLGALAAAQEAAQRVQAGHQARVGALVTTQSSSAQSGSEWVQPGGHAATPPARSGKAPPPGPA